MCTVAKPLSPTESEEVPLQAMIFDSVYNTFRGVEVYCRIFNGMLRKGDRIKCCSTDKIYQADEIGLLGLQQIPQSSLSAGQVGYLISGIKNAREVKVGDTVTHVHNPCREPIKGFANVKPMVFAGIYPIETREYKELRASLEKLQLNDASFVWTPETSSALGVGFRCGFLGMLHMEILQERLEREFGMHVLTTVPAVQYQVVDKQGKTQTINSPADMPEAHKIDEIQEPLLQTQIITKPEFIGGIIKLCIEKRGILQHQRHLTPDRVELIFELPLAEMVFDFFGQLKSLSRGYASLDYELLGFRPATLVRLDILLNNDKVDALAIIVHRDKAYDWGKKLCSKLKELLPRQMFEIAIQAAIGTKVIARETIKAMRKNVTTKCYGGDISRKKKLLEKQKQGKKRMH